MYLYVSFFNEKNLLGGGDNIYGKYFKPIKDVFPNCLKLDKSSIKGCIGYLKGKENLNKNCFLLNINYINVNESKLYFDFDIVRELDISNGSISKSLYKFAWRCDWIDKKTGYFPLVCIVDKLDFDTIRKGISDLKKTSSYSAELEELRSKNDWEGICSKFISLEEVKNNKEIWDNPSDLYNLAFACSKMGEPKNGLERDEKHLKTIKKYREYSIYFYKRCYELEPINFRYASALGYRYYLNVMELTKQRGRRDGSVRNEIDDAINWLDKAIELNPRSIKDNYRKGKLILDKQIDNFKYPSRKWTSEDLRELKNMEVKGVESLKRVIEIYEGLTDNKYRNYLFREYVRALYSLGSFYLDKAETYWDEYICSKMVGKEVNFVYYQKDIRYIDEGKKFIEKCFEVETKISLNGEMDISELVKEISKWHISPLDKLYKLGLVNLEIYFILKTTGKDLIKLKRYDEAAERFLLAAKNVAYEGRRQRVLRRTTDYIDEKLAKYYIILGRYDDAIKMIQRCRQSYIKNTYAMALILSRDKNNMNKVIDVLESAKEDRYNLAKELSMILLMYAYKLTRENQKTRQLIENMGSSISKKSKHLIEILDVGDMGNESR